MDHTTKLSVCHQLLTAALKKAGCTCPNPYLGKIASGGYCCRLCSTQVSTKQLLTPYSECS